MNGASLGQLKNSLGVLKQERDQLIMDVQEEKNIVSGMEQELLKIKRQQQFLGGQLRDKELALQDYDRMIRESEMVLSKLIENSQKLLQSIEGEAAKIKQRQFKQ